MQNQKEEKLGFHALECSSHQLNSSVPSFGHSFDVERIIGYKPSSQEEMTAYKITLSGHTLLVYGVQSP